MSQSQPSPIQYALALQTEPVHAAPVTPESEASTELERRRTEARLRRILRRKQEHGDLAGMAACFIHLGDLALVRGDSEEAGEMYRQALQRSREAHTVRRTRAQGA